MQNPYRKRYNGINTNAFRYCGEYYDKETGTIYLRARYYNPSNGRFTQRDSFAGKQGDPLSLNLYTYCHNNPILYWDSSGHSIKSWFKDRVDDWKTGAEIIKDEAKEITNDVKGFVNKHSKKIKKGAITIGDKIGDKFSPVYKKVSGSLLPLINIFNSKNDAQVLRAAHTANIVNIGSGKEYELIGVDSKKSEKYVKDAHNIYENMVIINEISGVDIRGLTWDEIEQDNQIEIINSMVTWDRQTYYNTAAYITGKNIKEGFKAVWNTTDYS